MYDVEHIKIFDENGALVSPTYYNSFYNSFDVLKLDAGSYYFTTNQMSSTSDACLQIAITKDFTGDTVIDYDDMQILDVSHGVSLKKDSMYDKDYFAVNITDQGKYLFSNLRIELFDSQLNRINSRYDDNHTYYELAAGTYYVIIAHDYTSEIGNYLTVRLERYEA